MANTGRKDPVDHSLRFAKSYIETPYDEDDYYDWMHTVPSDLYYSEVVEQHSEWFAPYANDAPYPDLEEWSYRWPRWPDVPDWPETPPGTPPTLWPDTPPDRGRFCSLTCYGPSFAECCAKDNRYIRCHFSVIDEGMRGGEWRITGKTPSKIEEWPPGPEDVYFYAPYECWDDDEVVTVYYYYPDGSGYSCQDTLKLNCGGCCDTEPAVSYDTANSPETIAAGSSDSVFILKGCPPFQWSVAGTDFSMSNATTDSRTNTINAGASACGPATITVTDVCGDSCTGYVRCTTGSWTEKSTGVCVLSGNGTQIGYNAGPPKRWQYELIDGYQRQLATTQQNGKASRCTPPCVCGTDTDTYCRTGGNCGGSPVNCIDPDHADWIPCRQYEYNNIWCYCVINMRYYEWEC